MEMLPAELLLSSRRCRLYSYEFPLPIPLYYFSISLDDTEHLNNCTVSTVDICLVCSAEKQTSSADQLCAHDQPARSQARSLHPGSSSSPLNFLSIFTLHISGGGGVLGARTSWGSDGPNSSLLWHAEELLFPGTFL